MQETSFKRALIWGLGLLALAVLAISCAREQMRLAAEASKAAPTLAATTLATATPSTVSPSTVSPSNTPPSVSTPLSASTSPAASTSSVTTQAAANTPAVVASTAGGTNSSVSSESPKTVATKPLSATAKKPSTSNAKATKRKTQTAAQRKKQTSKRKLAARPNQQNAAIRGCNWTRALPNRNLGAVCFSKQSAALSNASKYQLNKVSQQLLASKAVVELAGYTDSSGAKASNLSLSEKRSQAVAEYLVSQGVNKDQLKAKGYGERGAQHAQRERRVELRVLQL
jgi:outer membrane protein OmpA-like peptidoglycan-associated protein